MLSNLKVRVDPKLLFSSISPQENKNSMEINKFVFIYFFILQF